MFTGIIRETGQIIAANQKRGSRFFEFSRPKKFKIKTGDSISINGICSTIRKTTRTTIEVEYMPETIKKTTVASFRTGVAVNLEKPLKFGDALDGHLIQGHVDTVGRVISRKNIGRSKIFKIKTPPTFSKLIIPRGSIAVDGVSLTISSIGRNFFSVSLVDHTLTHTTLGGLKIGSLVNIEFDIIGKYLSLRLK